MVSEFSLPLLFLFSPRSSLVFWAYFVLFILTMDTLFWLFLLYGSKRCSNVLMSYFEFGSSSSKRETYFGYKVISTIDEASMVDMTFICITTMCWNINPSRIHDENIFYFHVQKCIHFNLLIRRCETLEMNRCDREKMKC